MSCDVKSEHRRTERGQGHHCWVQSGSLEAESELGILRKVREAPGEESSATTWSELETSFSLGYRGVLAHDLHTVGPLVPCAGVSLSTLGWTVARE